MHKFVSLKSGPKCNNYDIDLLMDLLMHLLIHSMFFFVFIILYIIFIYHIIFLEHLKTASFCQQNPKLKE